MPPTVFGWGAFVKIELSKQAFYEAWKHFQLGAKPLVLNVLPDGVLQSERRAAEKRAWEELRALGFGDRDREDDVHGLLLPLHRYERAFDITYRYRTPDGDEASLSGLVANVRTAATMAVRTDTSVRLQALPAASALLRILISYVKSLFSKVSMPLILGVKFGASGSNSRLLRDCSKVSCLSMPS